MQQCIQPKTWIRIQNKVLTEINLGSKIMYMSTIY